MKGIMNKSTASKRRVAAFVLVAIMLVSIFSAAVEKDFTIITLNYDGVEFSYATDAETVGEFFEKENISVKDNDYVSHNKTDSIEYGMKIYVSVAKYITVYDEDATYGAITFMTTVEDVLRDFGSPLSDADGCFPVREERVYDGSVIYVTRANKVIFERFGTQLEYDTHSETVGDFLNELGVTYDMAEEKVVPSEDTILTDNMTVVIKNKTDAMSPLDFGIDLSTARVITCTATAYTPSADECGKDDGITATGAKCEVGVVAVDPKVIPLGTKLYIETVDGSFVYGYCSAQDTGGAIKGNKVDLAMNTKSECFQFGRRQVKVYILS
ncbi:MAG: DUF348 domain-containing protein [Clostridia bacterium]|nr:DUF348 domain-containing protein [Clostridia bacterium]